MNRGREQKPLKSSAGGSPAMRNVLIQIEPAKIALFKAIIESYDNLATVRTEDPENHHLRLYFGAESEPDVRELLDAIGPEFSLRHVA